MVIPVPADQPFDADYDPDDKVRVVEVTTTTVTRDLTSPETP